jgi:hypothetical protein
MNEKYESSHFAFWRYRISGQWDEGPMMLTKDPGYAILKG